MAARGFVNTQQKNDFNSVFLVGKNGPCATKWRHDTQQNDIRHNETQLNDTQHNDIQYNDFQHNNKNMRQSALWHFMLSVAYAECRSSACHAKCHYADCFRANFPESL